MAEQSKSILHEFNESGETSFSPKVFILLFIITFAGIFSGYFLATKSQAKYVVSNNTGGTQAVTKGAIYGSSDTKTFKDTAQGILQSGGKNNVGQFHLVREGGESQYVYLTSSLVDLSQFIGKKVEVWGQTQKSDQVGWLMDVGRVEVLQ